MKLTVNLNELKSQYYFNETAQYAENNLNIKFLKETRSYYLASCPFHSDTTPSLYLYKKDGRVRFRCFSEKCEGRWDIFALIQDIKKCSFIDSVKWFAHYVGVNEVILPHGGRVKIGQQ